MKMHAFSVKMRENARIFYERPYPVGQLSFNYFITNYVTPVTLIIIKYLLTELY